MVVKGGLQIILIVYRLQSAILSALSYANKDEEYGLKPTKWIAKIYV